MNEQIDDTICPFCHQKNKCMANVEEPCWCNNANVPKELRTIAPEKSRGKVCICLSCIQLYKENPDRFISNMKMS
jgi:hypothetical protein